MRKAGLFAGLILVAMLPSLSKAQAACGQVTIYNNAWQVRNCSSTPENFVFSTPQGIAFSSAFEVAPGSTMPVMGNIAQPYRYWYCPTPTNPTDTATGQPPQYNAASVVCK